MLALPVFNNVFWLYCLDVHMVIWAATVRWGGHEEELQQEQVLCFQYYPSFYNENNNNFIYTVP